MLQSVPATITTKNLQRATRIAQELAFPGTQCKGRRWQQPKYRARLKQRWQEWSGRLIGLRIEILVDDSWRVTVTAQEICDSINGIKPLPWKNLRGETGIIKKVQLVPYHQGNEGVEVKIQFDNGSTEFVELAHCGIPT